MYVARLHAFQSCREVQHVLRGGTAGVIKVTGVTFEKLACICPVHNVLAIQNVLYAGEQRIWCAGNWS
jgi:hypothetical protein